MFSTNPDLPQSPNTFQINQDDKFFTKLLSRDSAFSSPPPPPSTEYGRVTATIPFDWESQPGTPKDTTVVTGNKTPCRIPLPPPPSHQYFSELSSNDKTSPSSQFRSPKNFSNNLNPPPVVSSATSIKLRQSSSRSLLFNTMLGKLISLKKNLGIATAKTSPSYLPPSLSSNSSTSSSTGFFVSGSKLNGRRKSRFATSESSFDSKTEDGDEEDDDEGANGSPTSTLCFASSRRGRGSRNFGLSECYRGKS